MIAKNLVRIAAMADIHYGRASQGTLQSVLGAVSDRADVLLICGDLTDYGLPDEARMLTKELANIVKIPIVTILGNHDYESGKVDEIRQIFSDAGIVVLDGDSYEFHGVGFAGVKGFAGGFGRGALGPWGEEIIKRFVHEAVDEALKLETALKRLRTNKRIVLLHYSPIRDTVEGEPPEIFSYLGSGRLEEPINRYDVTAVFHGHAHHGRPAGQTGTGVPVFNVSLQLRHAHFPDEPFQLLDVHVDSE